MEEIKKNLKSIKTRKVWGLPRPEGYLQHVDSMNGDEDNVSFDLYTQADMIREYFPSSHKINNHSYYPDIYMSTDEVDPQTGAVKKKYFCNPVPRKTYAFQQIIVTKRGMHLIGNDTQFECVTTDDQKTQDTFKIFRKGWTQKDMDTIVGKAIIESLIVADCAVVFYMKDGKVYSRTLSYFNGDTLYPHYEEDGETLSCFARSLYRYDDDGNKTVEYLEVWDKEKHYIFRKTQTATNNPVKKIFTAIQNLFNFDGYDLVKEEYHGFGRVPVAYHRRNDGSAWVYAQQTIDDYELAKSQLAQNNEEYGEPALVVCSEEEAFAARDQRGTIKEFHVSQGDKVEYLQAQSAADSYMKQIEDDYKLIYRQAFCVDTPEMKSGDLPAQALKIMYSLAYEMASVEALQYQNFIRQNVELFSIGYGIEKEMTLDFINLQDHMRYWIAPYVHESTSSVVSDLAMGVQNKFISRETACERLSTIYTTPNEWSKIQAEEHKADAQDILNQVKLMKAQAKASQNQSNSNQTE